MSCDTVQFEGTCPVTLRHGDVTRPSVMPMCQFRASAAVEKSSESAAVCSERSTDGGSHDPGRLEPPDVTMKKSIPGKTQ